MKMISKKQNGVFTIYIEGQIDTRNANEVEEMFRVELDKKDNTEGLVINCEGLEYISSAGLRVILKLIKAYKDLKLVDVRSEVFEIFEMTGFTELVEIKKAHKTYDVTGCAVLGEGAKGIVYRYNEDTIIKVYKNDDVLPLIEKERELAKKAFILGIPTAISYDVCKVGNRYGSVFELLDCESLSQLLKRDPRNVQKYAYMFADLLKLIHGTSIKKEGISSGKDIVYLWFNESKKYLNPSIAQCLLEMIDSLPEESKLIHGDYHTNNIMVQDGEPILIDMDTLAYGNRVIELAIIDFTYNTFNDLDKSNTMKFLGISSELAKEFYNHFISRYFDGQPEFQMRKFLNKINTLSYLRIIRHVSRREPDSEIIGQAVAKLEELVMKIDSLAV